MSCDVSKAELILQTFRHFIYVTTHSSTIPPLFLRHSSFSIPSVALPTSQLILQPFHHFIYVTAHSPSLPLLHLRHSSFSNLLPLLLRHRLFIYVTWRAAHVWLTGPSALHLNPPKGLNFTILDYKNYKPSVQQFPFRSPPPSLGLLTKHSLSERLCLMEFCQPFLFFSKQGNLVIMQEYISDRVARLWALFCMAIAIRATYEQGGFVSTSHWFELDVELPLVELCCVDC